MWVTNYLQTRFCFTVWVLWVTILGIQWYRLCLGVHLLKDLHWKSCGLCWRSSLGWRPCVWHNLGLGSLICLEPRVESTASEYTWRGKCISFSQMMARWDLQSPAVRAHFSLAILKGSMSSSAANKLPSVECGGARSFLLGVAAFTFFTSAVFCSF